jgi:membrane-associated protein
MPMVRDHMSAIVLLGIALGGAMLIGGTLWRLVHRRLRAP